MNDADDEIRNIALAAVAGVVALVIAGVIALAASVSAPGGLNLQRFADVADPFEAPQQLWFAPGSERLPPDAEPVLGRVADAARSRGGVTVSISVSYAASSGSDATADAGLDLARARLSVVRHALEAYGVQARDVVAAEPHGIDAAIDPKRAGLVELHTR